MLKQTKPLKRLSPAKDRLSFSLNLTPSIFDEPTDYYSNVISIDRKWEDSPVGYR
jgi:hypothetical protein